eukprot:748158-Hanusia_phi.AAC.2
MAMSMAFVSAGGGGGGVSLGAGVQLPAFPSSSPALLAKGLSSPQTSLGMKPGLVLSGRGVETKNGGADIERLVGESKFSAMARQSRDKNEVSQSAGRKIEWVGKRYFLWRVAEWAFDKVMVFLQVSVALALWTVDKLKRETQLESKLEDLRYPTYKSPKEVPSLFSKNEKVVSSPPASLPAAAVSSSDITTTSSAGEGTSERKYSTPSISTSLSTEVEKEAMCCSDLHSCLLSSPPLPSLPFPSSNFVQSRPSAGEDQGYVTDQLSISSVDRLALTLFVVWCMG